MSGGDDARRRFEQHVLVEFERTVFEYCQLAVVHPRVDPAALRIRITVVTGPPVETIRVRVREVAQQTVRRELDGAVLLGVTFARDVANQDHGCQILIQPPLPDAETDPSHHQGDPGHHQGDPGHHHGEPSHHHGGPGHGWGGPAGPLGAETPTVPLGGYPPAAAGRLMTLTLGYDDRLSWSYPLLPAPSWIPLGRGLVTTGVRSAIRVPDFVAAVPRGPLLLLRYLPGVVTLRRSAERPGYHVWVDGRPVPPGGTAEVRDAGRIRYTAGHIRYPAGRSAADLPADLPASPPASPPADPGTTLTYRLEQGL